MHNYTHTLLSTSLNPCGPDTSERTAPCFQMFIKIPMEEIIYIQNFPNCLDLNSSLNQVKFFFKVKYLDTITYPFKDQV